MLGIINQSLIYLFIYIITAFFMYLYQISTNKACSCFFLVSTFFILFLFLILRYDVGADYLNYTNGIQKALDTNNYKIFEIGWVPLFFVMDILNLSPHFFFVFTSFISVFFILCSIRKSNALILICLYLCLGYIELFTIVRQCFAASIYTYFFSRYLKTNRIKNLLVGSFISCLFHKSLLVTLIVVLFCFFINKKRIRWSNKKTVFIYFFLYISLHFINFGDIILGILQYTPYAVYSFMGDRLIGKSKGGTGIGMLLRYLIILGCVFEYKRNWKNNNYMKSDIIRVFTNNLLFFLFLMSNQIKIFIRLPMIFNTSLCCLYMNSKGKLKKLQTYCIVIACFLLYFFTVLKSTRDIQGSMQLLPYHTIFENNIIGA